MNRDAQNAARVPGIQRPALDIAMSENEFLRWYWLTDELRAFARDLGVSASGSKSALADRIAAALAGRAVTQPTPVARTRAARLTAPLTASTLIPKGQTCSQVVREWFVAQVGAGFHFNEALRRFIAEADGTNTLGEALAVWRQARDGGPRPIDDQFEYNRFTRAWHTDHPVGSRADLLRAWRIYRATPIEERGRI